MPTTQGIAPQMRHAECALHRLRIRTGSTFSPRWRRVSIGPPRGGKKSSFSRRRIPMAWYNYLAAFFAGAFLANVVPHFTHGISGDRFPTPFAHPPGRGLSSPTVNVVWALVNLVVGYVLFRAGNVSLQET